MMSITQTLHCIVKKEYWINLSSMCQTSVAKNDLMKFITYYTEVA